MLREKVVARYAVFTLAVLTASLGAAQQRSRAASAATPNVDTIVTRMEAAQIQNRARYRPYTMTREYRLYGSSENEKPTSEITAAVSFAPPDQKSFSIEEVRGSDRGKTIVEHVLRNEVDAAKESAQKNGVPGGIDHQHYDFTLLGQNVLDGHSCWLLRAKPKFEDKRLIDGTAWVDKETYLVRRLEGDLAKSPSWWIKSVYVTVTFAGIDGMWLQTNTIAIADVRIVGRHIFTGEAVKVRTGNEVATLQTTAADQRARNRRRASPSILGAASVQ